MRWLEEYGNSHSHWLGLLMVCVAGCSYPQPANTAPLTSGDPSATTICTLAQRGDIAEGKVLRITADYNTDGVHYEHLIDAACGKQGVLNIGNVDLVPNNSVKKFNDEATRRCKEKEAEFLCVIDARVDVLVRVVRSSSGDDLVANTLEFYSFKIR